MRTHCLLLLVCSFLFLAQPAFANADGLSVTFMATPTKAPGEVGHAFLCISVGTAGGSKEDCFGFYPQSATKALDGPGRIERELSRKEKPERFSTVVTSVTVPISIQTRQLIYAELERWAGKDYKLVSNNCGDMVFAVAKVAGIPLPPRSALMTPNNFVNGLKLSVEAQASSAATKKAADESHRAEAQRQQRAGESAQRALEQLQQAQRQQEQVEAARRLVEQAEAARKVREQVAAAEQARKLAEQAEQVRKAAEAAQRARQTIPVIRP